MEIKLKITHKKQYVNKGEVKFPCCINSSLACGNLHLFHNDLELLKTVSKSLNIIDPKLSFRIGKCMCGPATYFLSISEKQNGRLIAYQDGIKVQEEVEEWIIIPQK